MGDIKKTRKKFVRPASPFSKTRIEEERVLMIEYGLKNKKELWRLVRMLKGFKEQAKQTAATAQIKKEKELLFKRLGKMGLLKTEATSDDILGLNVKDLLERRLQTIVYKKGLTRTVKQARQFIVHEHILVGDNKVSTPGYLVRSGEEQLVTFAPFSLLADPNHIERSKKTEVKADEKGKQN